MGNKPQVLVNTAFGEAGVKLGSLVEKRCLCQSVHVGKYDLKQSSHM